MHIYLLDIYVTISKISILFYYNNIFVIRSYIYNYDTTNTKY